MTFRLLLTSLFSTVLLMAPARQILTPRAADDYKNRLGGNRGIARKITLPAGITAPESDALKFLYAYLPTSDVLDYDSDFFLDNVRLALQAAEEMPWGKSIPDREWRHFVLPVRVNNENLDASRRAFYEELKPRVRNLSMKDAILEVNHWCHEKVSYQPSDARTSSPLETVKNALGRCGEESTFTVAALRSVGIPARQVYTPRWAHTDDNHAWVEAWADGQWYFLGACEPEAVLNLAWFNAPASRGMLMTTKVTGAYDGPEEQLDVTPISTVINVTENYAPVCKSTVFVTDPEGKPVENAAVRFSLYNYAEFYPLAVKRTDAAGRARFTSGLGDMVVWATDGRRFELAPLTAGDTLRLVLDKDASFAGSIDFNLTPPVPGGNVPEVSPEAAALNERRKAYEDSVRHAYVSTFPTPERAREICRELGLDDSAAELLVKSRGNHAVIERFLRETPAPLRKKAVALLGALAEKDLHDVSADVLAEQMALTRGDESSPLYNSYVLNPRVEYEMLRPFRKEILQMLTAAQIEDFVASPRFIAEYINSRVALDSLYNPEKLRQSAPATLKAGIATPLNKAIAFVAVCRSLGIPARIDPVSRFAQFADKDGRWQDVAFETAKDDAVTSAGKGILALKPEGELTGRQPKYYSQFSLSRIVDGAPQLMEFDDFESLESINARREPLAPGQYLLVTGQRLADGSVLARAQFFNASAGETAEVPLVLRQEEGALQVIGNLDAELTYVPVDFRSGKPEAGAPRSILSTTGRGYYVLGMIAPGHEPSAHAVNDIAAAADELAATGRTLLLLFPDADAAAHFRLGDYGRLPENVAFGIDNGTIAGALRNGLEISEGVAVDMPLFVVADSFNRIIFFRHGYDINLGETLARILRSVE